MNGVVFRAESSKTCGGSLIAYRSFILTLLLALCACVGDAQGTGEGTAASSLPAAAKQAEIRSGNVTLLVPPGDKERPEIIRLAAELDRAATGMAARIPLSPVAPIRVVVEPDYVAQIQHTEKVGEAVLGPSSDIHLVFHPDDLFAYKHTLARLLIARAGLAGKTPWIEQGAALWLSGGDWYGRPWKNWLPLFAAARVLPQAADLLAEAEQRDSSGPLWIPPAAMAVDRLRGSTLAEKLAAPLPAAAIEQTLRVLAVLPPPAAPPRARPRLPFLKGVSFAMLNRVEGGYHAPSVDRQLERLSRLGSNSVSIMPFAFQSTVDSPELYFLHHHPRGETDLGMVHAARRARARGFVVLYKPHLWIRRSWPGELEMKNEADWDRWWTTYRRYVLHHALLAAWTKSELFSVGVELSKTVRRPEWPGLIDDTRLFFSGPVTYSGNWYGDLEQVPFWARLDYIGIDAYFPLSGSPEAGKEDLRRGARQIAERMAAASRKHGKPVLLTEVGFAARRAAWVNPHEEGGTYSEEDQALAYQALFEALGRQRWLAGAYVWKAFSDDRDRTDADSNADFRFLGRRAEAVVRDYFTR